jgi:hypothetical protein
MSRQSLAFKALRELGPKQISLYAWYQILLKSGYLRRRTPAQQPDSPKEAIRPLLDLPDKDDLIAILGQEGVARLLAEADEIVAGQTRLFGADPVPLHLTVPGELAHWTRYERGQATIPASSYKNETIHDIKLIWEPARFGWAYTLGRAYYLSGDERYAEAFWAHTERFLKANPPNLGPNWMSGQEVALRIFAFAFAAQVFADSPHSTPQRQAHLAQALAAHAKRIPPTLLYARAQNNNHLLSEAAGLLTAGLALPHHPRAHRWRNLGWKWFNRGIKMQISDEGVYVQQSTNYHRLMLQLALWVHALEQTGQASGRISPEAKGELQQATRWLLALTDEQTGRVPNLGPNDGAYILPLTIRPFHDYRPVLQAAALAFLGQPAFESGPGDEIRLWFCPKDEIETARRGAPSPQGTPRAQRIKTEIKLDREPNKLAIRGNNSWAYLRAAELHGRPGHADQLHLDLWWRDLNLTQDAGTFLYNADPPWDNALTHAAVHNTVTVEGRDQMTRAGRFLYVDKAQAHIVSEDQADDGSWMRLTAEHNGYHDLGITQRRSVTAQADDRWLVEDVVSSSKGQPKPISARLHWLLPDCPWDIAASEAGHLALRLESPHGWVMITLEIATSNANFQLVRAGEVLHGKEPGSPTHGWVSPTYANKQPALSLSVTVSEQLPLFFQTIFEPTEKLF